MSEHKRRRRIWLGAVCGVLALGAAAYVLGWSPILEVKKVEVVGAPNPSEQFVIQKTVRVGDKLARLEIASIEATLAKFSWLDRSSIHRDWLKRLVIIRVWPRTPIAQYQSRLVDRSGVLFDLPNVDPARLPIVTAPDAKSVKFATSLLDALPTTLSIHLTCIDMKSRDWASLCISEPSLKRKMTVVWGDMNDMELKVKVYQALIALPENAKVTYIDLSAPHAPIVK